MEDAPFYQTPEETQESQRLFMDNLKLWDCLALARQGNMSMMTAINAIFTLSDADYVRAFPNALQSVYARFPGGVVRYDSSEMAVQEDNRLKEENERLHAVVWTLRDNPSYQAESTLAAIFSLDDIFRDTFIMIQAADQTVEAEDEEEEKYIGQADYEGGGVSNPCFQMD